MPYKGPTLRTRFINAMSTAFSSSTNPDPRPDLKMKDLDERNRPKPTKATKTAKASGGFDPKPINKALFDPKNFAKPKSRQRTSSEIAAGVKNTPSKMQTAGLSKSGNTMLMGSKEVETPSTFNTSAASNMAKAPNFAKMAESGSTAKEIKSSFKDYKKVVKGQIKDHKTAIKVQNKTARTENKATKAEKQTSKKVDKLTKRYNKAKR